MIVKEKKVSIIIRTKNEEQWIEICIRKILEQSYKNVEIIIVDNHSKDKTLQKIKKYKLKVVKIKKFFPGKAINLGIKKSKGEIIVCLSAHCIPIDKFWLKNLVNDLAKKKVAAIYGKQSPLPYSSPMDKRDLYNTFGDEKRIQYKDTFFHNANSAFHKKIWLKNKFDEKILHIEDRIWANEIIKKGYKIIYEPKAQVFHWHGVNQSMDEKRCREIVSILENLNYLSHHKTDIIKFKNLKCVAVIPILEKSLILNKSSLLEIAIKQIKKSKFVNDIFVYSNNNHNKLIAKKHKISILMKRQSQSDFYLDIISSVKNFVNKLEQKGKFYDLVLVLTENFPFRSSKIFDLMIKTSINNNYDVVLPSKKLRGSIFLKDKTGVKTLINGTIPSQISKQIFLSRVGISTILRTSKLRTSNIMQNKIGFYKIDDQLSFIEITKENVKKFNQLRSSKFNLNL